MSELAFLGRKQSENPFPVWPYFDEKEERALKEVLESRVWWRTPGTKTLEFERAFAGFTGSPRDRRDQRNRRSGSCQAGLGITAGDEVILPDFTFVATASAVLVCECSSGARGRGCRNLLHRSRPCGSCHHPAEQSDYRRAHGGHPADLDRLKEIAGSGDSHWSKTRLMRTPANGEGSASEHSVSPAPSVFKPAS